MNVRFSILLVFLLGVLLLLPILSHSERGLAFLALAYGLVLLSGVLALEGAGWVRLVAIGLMIPALGIDLADVFTGERHPSLPGMALDATLLTFVGGSILRHILRRDEVTSDLILGGTCVYLLIGILFAQLYAMLELVAPGSFVEGGRAFVAAPEALVPQFVKLTYFSFVSLTTLGYGDVSPVLPLARAVATLEAVIGQLYLAVFIGSLVGQRIARAGSELGGLGSNA
jgi:hypothetical protein